MNALPLRESVAHGDGAPPERRASRAWRVLHAAESPHRIAPLVGSQMAVGMSPAVVTPSGLVELGRVLDFEDREEPAHSSLLNAWSNVRQWRKVILDAQPATDFELLHAHSFAAGMAGVRNCPATVYFLDRFIEDLSSFGAGEAAEHGSWLMRSFRVAEQFVLSRAAAVVVPCESHRQAVLKRGAAAENVFAIPEALDPRAVGPVVTDEDWLIALGIDRWHRVLIHAPEWKIELDADGGLSERSRGMLQAFAIAAAEEDGAYLLVEANPAAVTAANSMCESLEIAGRAVFINDSDRQRAFDAAHIIVADACSAGSITPAPSTLALRALLTGKTLLAADLPCNRDVTPSGRGCLWYRGDDFKDLAYRMAFLARNRDFRMTLAESGQRFLLDTRDSASIALEYDRVYRHVAQRRKSGGLQTPAATLTPVQATF